MPQIKVPARFQRRLKTLAARQGKVRDDLRALEAEIAEYLQHNEEASEALETAIEALSRLA
jgi:hypothetical protein